MEDWEKEEIRLQGIGDSILSLASAVKATNAEIINALSGTVLSEQECGEILPYLRNE